MEHIEEQWTPWRSHDDSGLPSDVTPFDLVQAVIGSDLMSPMLASEIDWHCPGDPVTRYRVRRWRALGLLKGMAEVKKMETAQ